MIQMNHKLAESKGFSEETIHLLEVLYRRLAETLKRPKVYTGSPKEAVERVRQLEYSIQYLWNFEENPDMFTYEFQLEGCECPKMDNEDLKGTDQRVYNMHCPYHGNRVEVLEWEDLEE